MQDLDPGPFDCIIAGGQVIGQPAGAPSRAADSQQDVAIRDGRIVRIAPRISDPSRRRIDAHGLIVLPGLIDPHVHLGLPMKGTTSSDDPSSGTAAALFGGVTTVIDFTRQQPGQRLVDSLASRLSEFADQAYADYALHVCVTDFAPDFADTLDEQLTELADCGATSLKVFTCYSAEGMQIRPDPLRALLSSAAARGMLVLVHAEDDQTLLTSEERLLDAGRTAPTDYPSSRPPEAEARAIRDVIRAARQVGAPVYFVHVSTQAGLQAILAGRGDSSQPVYLETCPQYLLLDDAAYARADGIQFLVAPPLRKPSDRAALLQALHAGLVDVVATDHCPFHSRQKAATASFADTPKGLPGVETRLALLHSVAVASGRMTFENLVRVAARNPARIFGLYPRKGCIAPGADADLVLFDPSERWTLSPASLHMNTDFSPYAGERMTGRVRSILLRGELVVENGALARRPGGRFLKRALHA
jgi:dihydropyrimidinase